MSVLRWLLLAVLVLAPLGSTIIVAARAWRWFRRRTHLPVTPKSWIDRPRIWGSCLATAIVSLLLLLYAWLIEPGWVEVTRLELRTVRAIGGNPRFKIVHLSDLHMNRIGARERRIVEIVRAERPDLILLTGDYLNDRSAEADFVTFLALLEAPLGVYGVGGNWDGKFPISDLFANAKATLLRDDYQSLANGDLLLVGLEYLPHRTAREIAEGASAESYKILLHHSPEAVDSLMGARFDLFLCGHTHGGQLRLPLLGGLLSDDRYSMGRYWIAPPQTGNPAGTGMYVNRGVGCWGFRPPLRFLCRPEVAVIEIVRR